MSGVSDLFFLCEITLAPSAGGLGSQSESGGLVDLIELAELGTESEFDLPDGWRSTGSTH